MHRQQGEIASILLKLYINGKTDTTPLTLPIAWEEQINQQIKKHKLHESYFDTKASV